MEVRTPAAVVPDVRISVDPQDLEKIPKAFRGTVYESASYAVNHFYKFKEKELRAIETLSPVHVIESSMDMTLTVSCPILLRLYPSHTALFFHLADLSPISRRASLPYTEASPGPELSSRR